MHTPFPRFEGKGSNAVIHEKIFVIVKAVLLQRIDIVIAFPTKFLLGPNAYTSIVRIRRYLHTKDFCEQINVLLGFL